jgi:hypothetical protein
MITRCGICGTDVHGELAVCHECQQAFEPDDESENVVSPSSLDLRKYDSPMFPWEQPIAQPRLISLNPLWLIALGLVVLVLLLAIVRTPLPSCWEISS